MKDLILFAVASSLCMVHATPAQETDHAWHAKRTGAPMQWKRGPRVEREAILPIKVALTQSRLDDGYELLMDVRNSGKQWSAGQVHDHFAPTDEAVEGVRGWLLEAGINSNDITHYENKGWLAFDIPASQAEDLFRTEYYEYESNSKQSGRIRIGCESYHIPNHLQEHIDYITPGVTLSPPLKRSYIERVLPPPASRKSPQPTRAVRRGGASLPADLQNCGSSMTPACLRALYNIPLATRNDSVNSLGVYESADTYDQEDLNRFFQNFAPQIPRGTQPKLDSIDGGVAPTTPNGSQVYGESLYDLDIAYSLIYPQTVTLYQVDNVVEPDTGGFDDFLDALDGSYCNYTAHGVTPQDAQNDTISPGSYNGTRVCGAYKPTRVISISYNYAEQELSWNYARRQCNEWMKLALQGVTVVFSSGDYGVGAASGCLGANGTIFNPSYPSCPYILSAGGTRLYPNQTIKDPESAYQEYENSPTSGTSGGFSNYFPAPAYQQAAISKYFAYHDPGYPSYVAGSEGQNIGAHGGVYNRAGRGMPDVSSNAARFRVYDNLSEIYAFGTSLAAPTWSSIITLINEERTAVGKGSVGFINPILYENEWIFNDVVNGSNPNCNSSGFHAVPGWDPVTGLGTPDYPKLLQVLLSLP